MPRLDGYGQEIHQPRYDTLVRDIGRTNIGPNQRLFGSAAVGDRSRTNMDIAGALGSDATFVMAVLRVAAWAKSLADTEFSDAFGNLNVIANALGTQARAHDLFALLAYGATMTLNVGNKPQFQAPMYYFPAGGGPHGSTTVNNRATLTMGLPSTEAILRLGIPIATPSRQIFNVQVDWYAFPRATGGGDGAGGGALGADLDPLANWNQFDGAKYIAVTVDGKETRDVE